MGWTKRHELHNGWSIWDRGGVENGVRLQHQKTGEVIDLPQKLILDYAVPVFAKAAAYRAVADCLTGLDSPPPRFQDFYVEW